MGITNGVFTADIETWRLAEVGQAYLDLLDGKVLTGPGDAALMPGSGQPPNEAMQRTPLAGPLILVVSRSVTGGEALGPSEGDGPRSRPRLPRLASRGSYTPRGAG